jgi:hypothetical protein
MRHTEVHLVELLGAGSHCHPRTGGCLLEVVSTVPGGVWTDHPQGLDPTLGYLARVVNDVTSDAERPALAPLIPSLAELTGVPPLEPTDTADVIAAAVAAAALPLADKRAARQVRRAVDPASPESEPGWHRRITRRRAARSTVRSAVHAVARNRAVDPDTALRTMLTDIVDLVRRLHGLPPAPRVTRSAAACREYLPVEIRRLAPDGADSLFYHCSAVLELWPSWLVPVASSGRAVETDPLRCRTWPRGTTYAGSH